jgi:transcriptional regulator with XRE-family HTH domain
VETFAERLRRLRTEQGLSVPALAGSVGVSPGAIRQLESGQIKNPSFTLGLRLANSLHIDPSYLALGEGHSVTDHIERLDARVGEIEKRLAHLSRGR